MRWLGWLLNALGAFPVDRGASDEQMVATARAILDRGDCVLIFPEGTRVRPGPLGEPKRGVGRLALESGVPVVPVAVVGTDDVRRGWRIRPHKVRLDCGRPITFARVQAPFPTLAAVATDRIWSRVMRQWESLGGLLSPRRAAVTAAAASPTVAAGQTAEALSSVDLLHGVLRDAGVSELPLQARAELTAGRLEPKHWSAANTAPPKMRAASRR